MNIGEVIKKRRCELGLNHHQIEIMSGITRRTVQRIEATNQGQLHTIETVLSCLGLKLEVTNESR